MKLNKLLQTIMCIVQGRQMNRCRQWIYAHSNCLLVSIDTTYIRYTQTFLCHATRAQAKMTPMRQNISQLLFLSLLQYLQFVMLLGQMRECRCSIYIVIPYLMSCTDARLSSSSLEIMGSIIVPSPFFNCHISPFLFTTGVHFSSASSFTVLTRGILHHASYIPYQRSKQLDSHQQFPLLEQWVLVDFTFSGVGVLPQ